MDAFPDEETDFLENTGDEQDDEECRIVCATVPSGARIRLDAFLAAASGESRSRVKKCVEDGKCTVDGILCTSADTRLYPGQEASLSLPVLRSAPEPEEGPLDILYEDEDIAVVNKPAGLTMHPCPSCPRSTLVNRLLARFPQLASQGGLRPGIIHRLDKDTSGIVIIALSEKARLRMAEAFAAREVHKTYLAITSGIPPARGESEQPIGRHPTQKTRMAVVPESKGGRNALTRWEMLYAQPEGKAALLAVRIFTGRTHQIRVHMAHAGYPLLGDAVYGPRDAACLAQRQMLHAWKLEFHHPVSGMTMSFTCPPPEDFLRVLLAMEEGMDVIILTGMPGCGKSAALKSLAARGLPVWSADTAVASLYKPGAEGWKMLCLRWGNAFLDPSGEINRQKLTSMLAGRPGMRRELEAIIHPLTRESLRGFFQRALRDGASAAAAEVPLWFECGWPKPPRAIIATVSCPDEARRSRLMQDRGWSREKIAAIESWQWSAQAKEDAADAVILNTGGLVDLDNNVDRLLQTLASMRDEGRKNLAARLRSLWGEA